MTVGELSSLAAVAEAASRDGVCGAVPASTTEEAAAEEARALTVSSIRRLISREYTWRISMPSSSAEADAAAAEKASSSMRRAAEEASSLGKVP